jgi:prepilin-type N-terminal cleavage/methylation domain-containing protein
MSQYKRGDTLIEVLFAIVIFCLVAVIAVSLMNQGVATAQSSLEINMARNEIDAQAEALRFVQNSFLAERELSADQQQFVQVWRKITGDPSTGGYAIEPGSLNPFNITGSCSELYNVGDAGSISSDYGFALNARLLQPANLSLDYNDFIGGSDQNYTNLIDQIVIQSHGASSDMFGVSPVQPRIIYTYSGTANPDAESSESGSLSEDNLGNRLYRKVSRVESIWIVAVKGGKIDDRGNGDRRAEYYDFHIRTCWNSLGRSTPTTIGTIVRLYNPEFIEAQPVQPATPTGAPV